MKWHARIMVAIGVALGCGVVSALVLALVDLYLTGHARPSMGRATIPIAGTSQAASVADLLLLSAIIVPGLVTWLLLRTPRSRGNNDAD